MAKNLDALSQVKQLINHSSSFVLNGGAGSGKTHTLVEVLKYVHQKNPNSRIACITYTNIAANQIKERAPFENMHVSTIHDFLWSLIKRYQGDIKKAFVQLLAEKKLEHTDKPTIDEAYLAGITIKYEDWKFFEKGIVSHDQVLSIAHRMFENSTQLSDILIDQYDYIFVDEYQDTADEVLDILVNKLKRTQKSNVVGFFGDRMQAIYKDDTSKSDAMIDNSENIQEVLLEDNRRNPKNIISLINKLRIRTDSLIQRPAENPQAPNWRKEGSIKFIYSMNENHDIEDIKTGDFCRGWDFSDALKCKELYLTRKFIAQKAGLPSLIDVADDQIIKYKNKINKEIDKKNIAIPTKSTFGQVITHTGVQPARGKMTDFISNNPDLFNYAKSLPYEHFKQVYFDVDQLFGRKKQQEQNISPDRKRNMLIEHLLHIHELLCLYENKQYNKFLRQTDFSIESIQSKRELLDIMNNLGSMSEKTIIEIMNYAHKMGICKKTPALEEFIEQNAYLWKRLEHIKFSEISCLYNYIENHTPYSTQHGVKGAEYDNVLVVLDNGGWRKYNFQHLFEGNGREDIKQRTARLLYVCCSRAKNNLIVYYPNPSKGVLEGASKWFDASNVVLLPEN